MGDISCNSRFLHYPTLFLILLFAFINHEFHFLYTSSLFPVSNYTHLSNENPKASISSDVPSPTKDLFHGSRNASSLRSVSDVTFEVRVSEKLFHRFLISDTENQEKKKARKRKGIAFFLFFV